MHRVTLNDLPPAMRRQAVEQMTAAKHNTLAGVGQVELSSGGSQDKRRSCGTLTPAARRDSLEKDLHDEILEHCKEQRWYVVHSRMDRKATVKVGTPDFCIAMPGGRTVWLECKRKGNKPTIQQQAVLFLLRHLGHTAEIVHDWTEAKAVLDGCPHGTTDMAAMVKAAISNQR